MASLGFTRGRASTISPTNRKSKHRDAIKTTKKNNEYEEARAHDNTNATMYTERRAYDNTNTTTNTNTERNR